MAKVVLGDLSFYCSWWTTGSVRSELLGSFKRPVFFEALKFLDDRQALLFFGLRRIGKTTVLYQLVWSLLERGVDKRSILFFSFDDASCSVDEVLEVFQQEVLKKNLADAGRVFVFFDEVQKCKNWQEKVKKYYDAYPNLKFLLSGSASISLEKKARESLAGRVYDFKMKPLSFKEFLGLKGIEFEFKDWKLFEKQAATAFFDHLTKGGFPEIAFEQDDEKVKKYVKNNVIDRIVLIDLPKEFGVKDYDLLKNIFELAARNPGFIVNYDSLSKTLGKTKISITNYFEYLQYGLAITPVRNWRKNFLSESRKQKKAFPANTAFTLALARQDDQLFGKILETLLVQELGLTHYFREREIEIDFVEKQADGSILAIEAKTTPTDADKQKLAKTMKKLGIKNGVIISKQEFDEKQYGELKITTIPCWLYLLFHEKLSKTAATTNPQLPPRPITPAYFGLRQ